MVSLQPEAPPRSKPVEAMQACGELPALPADLPQQDLEDALRTILRTKARGDEVFRECVLRQAELARWIEEG